MGLGPPPLMANGGRGTSAIVDPEAGEVGGFVHETVPQFITFIVHRSFIHSYPTSLERHGTFGALFGPAVQISESLKLELGPYLIIAMRQTRGIQNCVGTPFNSVKREARTQSDVTPFARMWLSSAICQPRMTCIHDGLLFEATGRVRDRSE
ncbi:hypothetical protein BJV74DRAFT_799720 [Russula compacta]|nr:hypothetical protein BJV74DRAFT_799720 [Russula compacta]